MMEIKNLTCVECPMGCPLEVTMDGQNIISVTGNGCPRGKLYAQNEVTCPKRVVTSTVRAQGGVMVPVKTDNPVPKAEIFAVMERINNLHPTLPVQIGDVLMRDVVPGVNVVATRNFNRSFLKGQD